MKTEQATKKYTYHFICDNRDKSVTALKIHHLSVESKETVQNKAFIKSLPEHKESFESGPLRFIENWRILKRFLEYIGIL